MVSPELDGPAMASNFALFKPSEQLACGASCPARPAGTFCAGRSVECEMTRRGDMAENCAYSDEQQRGNPVSIHAKNSRARLRNHAGVECDPIFVRSRHQASSA